MSNDSNKEVLELELHNPRSNDEPLTLEQIKHDDWDRGQPCPECESTCIREAHIQGELARHKDGTTEYTGSLDREGTIEYVCVECETILYQHPVASLFIEHGADFEQ